MQNETYNNTVPTVKHGSGSVLFWFYFAAPGTQCLESVQGSMKSQDYEVIQKPNALPSVTTSNLGHRSEVVQQGNDPKHTAATSIQEWLRIKHWTVLK